MVGFTGSQEHKQGLVPLHICNLALAKASYVAEPRVKATDNGRELLTPFYSLHADKMRPTIKCNMAFFQVWYLVFRFPRC